MQRPVAVFVLTFALAGCFGGSSGEAIPWKPERPRLVGSERTLSPPCTTSQLRPGLFLQGATGSLVGGITLRHAGGPACSLQGRPRVRFNSGSGKRVPWRVYAARSFISTDEARPASVLRSLRRGDEVVADLSWSNWCSSRGYEPPPAPAALVVSLPRGGGSFRLGLANKTPRCDIPGRPSQLGVAPFAAVRPEPAPSSHIPLAVAIIGPKVTRNPRAAARRGAPFHYRVALRNTSQRPFRFDRCPVYEEGWLERKETYVLNCRPMGTLRPGERAIFEMVLHVPRDAELGPSGFTWQLAPRTYEPPWAPASVLVRR